MLTSLSIVYNSIVVLEHQIVPLEHQIVSEIIGSTVIIPPQKEQQISFPAIHVYRYRYSYMLLI